MSTESINTTLGRLRTGLDHGYCRCCDTKQSHSNLNWEALVHHGAKRLECIDRKACERRKRKRKQ
jgi:hypothetical protein